MFTGSTIGRYSSRWLILVAVLELGLAAFFVFLAFTLPIAAEGFYLTAAILGVTGLVLLLIGIRVRASAAAADQLLAAGLAGQAQITGLIQTGMYLNEQPQVTMDLLVSLPDRPPYAARRKEFVPLILLGRLTSGAPLPVRVDPADPQRVVIDWANVNLVQPAFQAPFGQSMPPIQPVQPTSTSPTGSGMDESLAQVQAALASSGMQARRSYHRHRPATPSRRCENTCAPTASRARRASTRLTTRAR